jgi:hypothetical protein
MLFCLAKRPLNAALLSLVFFPLFLFSFSLSLFRGSGAELFTPIVQAAAHSQSRETGRRRW